jgi:Cdc6-like AAA superfamily ATPase
MRKLPDEEDLQELVEMAKIFEQQIKEQCDLAGTIYEKYEKRICEIKELKVQKQEA